MSEPYDTAQQKFIERGDITVRVAKMIDPSAFSEWQTMEDGKIVDHRPDTRQRYMQAKALHLAAEILKLAASQVDLARQLADSEATNWELLGVPSDRPELRKIINEKYGLP